MTNQAPARSATPELILTVLTGPEAGVVYKLVGDIISLGRAPENDVILQDNRSSRNHARIERRGSDYWIVDLESTAGVVVNGAAMKEAPLKMGDEITVGSTSLRFGAPQPLSLVNTSAQTVIIAGAPAPTGFSGQVPLAKNTSLGSPDPQAAGWLPPVMPSNNVPSGDDNRNFFILLAVAALAISAIFWGKSHSSGNKKDSVKDDMAMEEEIQDMTQTNQKRQEEIMAKGKDTQQYAEAQAFYLRGFREFEDGNYGRAVQNFEAALALYPDHPLAKRYLERSRLKNNELVTQALERGEKDFELERYTNAFNEYRTVLLLTNDPNNKNFQLAQQRIEAINLILMNSK